MSPVLNGHEVVIQLVPANVDREIKRNAGEDDALGSLGQQEDVCQQINLRNNKQPHICFHQFFCPPSRADKKIGFGF